MNGRKLGYPVSAKEMIATKRIIAEDLEEYASLSTERKKLKIPGIQKMAGGKGGA